MKRRIIKQANQAYTITLPIEWVRKNKISEKSEVNVDVVEKTLVINSENLIQGGKAKINVSKLNPRNIYRCVNALYAKGVDEIELISEKDISSKLAYHLNQTLGYALVEQKDNIYLIKDISATDYKNLDEIFKRVFQMILLFYESAIKDIFEKEKETLESLNARDFEVNKFCLYLQRAINKMSYHDSVKGRALFTYSFELEKIGDEIQRMWRTAIKYKIKKTSSLKSLTELSLEGLGRAFDAYYQFSSEKTTDVYDIRERIREDSMKLQKLDGTTARFVRYVVKIAEDAADLSHLTLMINLA